MAKSFYDNLSRLERRIMDAVYRLERATVADVVDQLDGEEIRHSIRVTMSKLEKKGMLTHHREGSRNVYQPTIREERARKSVMDHLIQTFFDGSPAHAILSFLDRYDDTLSPEEIAEIRETIRAAEHPKRAKRKG